MRSFKYFVQSTWLKEFVKQYAFVKKKKNTILQQIMKKYDIIKEKNNIFFEILYVKIL